jgi:putative flippase GtrA
MNRERLLEILRFLSVGVMNTLVGLSTIYCAKWFLQWNDVAANMLGYAVGLTVSFTLNSRWTFGYKGPRLVAVAKFAAVSLLAYCMNLLTVVVAIRLFEVNGYIAQAAGIVPYTVTSYLASKYLVFRSYR